MGTESMMPQSYCILGNFDQDLYRLKERRTIDGHSWHYTGGSDQGHLQEKEMQKGKMVVWGGLTNSWERKRREKQRRKGKIYPSEYRVPKNNKER